jgi:cytidylate kinase
MPQMAQTRVVTISHTTGAGGESIGRSVAKGLGFRYVDEEIIHLAAERHGIDFELVADAERRKGLLDRILGDMAAPPMMMEPTGGMAMLPPEAFMTRDDMRALIVEAIKETAERGQVVIVSHAAGIPLGGRRDVLRVLITASFEPRARRVAETTRSTKADAETTLKSSDAGRADYFQRFYGIERELPTHYDVVINTDTLTPEEATDLVIAAARRH